MSSMLIYAALIIITLLFSKLAYNEQNKYRKAIYFAMMIIIPSMFAALRYHVGTDYYIHETVFQNIIQNNEVEKHAEIGYIILNQIVAFFNGSYNVVLFLVSAISISCISAAIYAFKDDINPTFALLCYFLLYYQMSLNYIRQLLAASIAIYALVLFIKNRKLLAISLVIIAASFHVTAILMLAIMLISSFLTNDKYNKLKVVIYVLGVIALFTYPLYLSSVLDYVEIYIPQLTYFFNYLEANYQGIGVGFIRYPLIFIICGLLFYRNSKNEFKLFYHVALLGFCLWLTSYITVMEFYRIAHNLLLVLPLLLGYYYQNIDKLFPDYKWLNKISKFKIVDFLLKHKQLIYRSSLVLFLLFFWIYDFFILGAHETIPYQWIIGG